MHDRKSSYSVQTVEMALEIIELLADGTAEYSISQLAQKMGINRNKAFRLLSTLESRGMVEREESSGCFRLGLTALELSQKILRTASLIKHAHPVMEGLARKHDEAVYMTVIKGDEVVFLDMVDCEQHIKAAPLVGQRFPFFTNAAGKVIKALESRDLLERLFKKKKRKEGLPDLQQLESELDQIRKQGVAVDSGGLGEGIISVAVAVRDYAGKVVGAITLLGPSFRMLTDRLENEIIPSLQEGAELLSAKFGYAR
ncbi:IclR family transcriptional regulator [Geotalea uraniireducens]|uniref:IclR family transcriptional regulator n=1 Tax=Geotalea uraniireducens TaxID=351604 RepID=UPI0024932883|nr:IclR family transcriptional regulator [Geotalea uraniireducens]